MRRRAEVGSSLLEILIAIVILGIASAALLGGIATGTGASNLHRQQADDDAVLVSAGEAVLDNSLNPFVSCAPLSAYNPDPHRYGGFNWPDTSGKVWASPRTDVAATRTAGSATVSDPSILATDSGRFVTGAGIPASSYVGTVAPGASFLLSSNPTSQSNVLATTSGVSPVTIANVIISSIQYWDGSAWQPSCTQPQPPATDTFLNALQLITVKVTHPNGFVTMSRSFVKGPAS